MTFEWKDFINVARHLNGQKGADCPEDAAHRSAVNRAYYGAYGHSTEYAKINLDFKPTGWGTDHKNLRMEFVRASRDNPTMAEIASNLAELHEWRKKCDYHNAIIDHRPLSQMVQDAIDDAQEIIDIL